MNQQTIVNVLDRFLHKAQRVNKPYQAIKKTDEYTRFKDIFATAFADQGRWLIKNFKELLDSAGIDDNLQPLGLEQSQKLRGIISRDMPAMTELVSEFKVSQGLREFFEWAVKYQYRKWGYMVKSKVDFKLTNQQYINKLKDQASYLLNRSSLDETTLDNIIDIVSKGKLDALTNDEVASLLEDRFDEISDYRADMIARTESARAVGEANYATAKENGAQTKRWVTAGSNPCEICIGNEDDGYIGINETFSSGDDYEPAHPNDECYTEAGEIDLDSINIWGGE